MFRKTVFWVHLVCGVASGLVVVMMSVTGVLLTYERQMGEWAAGAPRVVAPTGAERRPLEELVAAVRAFDPAFAVSGIALRNAADAPVTVSAGRAGSLYVDPYTAEISAPRGEGFRAFLAAVRGWHRWFNVNGEHRDIARAVTGASNLAFLFLILSGLYLWLPRVAKWAAFKTRLIFNSKATTAKARDFNWHHVFGIWSAIPLAVVVATATVFSYPWANALVYRSFGEEPPARRGGGGPPAAVERSRAPAAKPVPPAAPLGYDALLASAAAHAGTDWRTLTLTLPAADAATVRVAVDYGDGGQPQLRGTLTLDAATGEVEDWAPFSSQTPAQQARSLIRFLHTGEALGLVGQTIAGIVSLTSVLMVWTGLALAWRRLVSPLFRPSR